MAYEVKFDTGEVVSFANQPSDQDIEEVVKKLGIKPKSATIPETPQKKSLGQKVLDAGTSVSSFFGGKGISELAGGLIAKATTKPEDRQYVDLPSAKTVAGSALQLGANFIPGAGIGAKLGTKALIGAGTGLAMDIGSKLQTDKTVGESLTPGVGTAVGAILPVAGAILKPATKIVTRLFKGLGSGLSGASTEAIDTIISNPKTAQKVSQEIAKSGSNKVLEQNAKTIINGVSKIKQEARSAFGTGLEQLAKTDIDNKVFRKNTQAVLDTYGSKIKEGKRYLTNVEFTDPKNLKTAGKLISELNNVKLDGKSLRKVADDIENAAYKVATSDERLSFNAFIKDLSASLKKAVSESTPKLNEINKAFSTDMQLAEAVEDIFGKVNYKNLSEVVKASKKLETLFSQKGLAPEVIDDFLNRIGVAPTNLRTSEAVRQIGQKATGGNAKGLTFAEITQQLTSSVITPEMVKNISIATGLTANKIKPLAEALKTIAPASRNIVIQALLQESQ
jgi:hypothetical protein